MDLESFKGPKGILRIIAIVAIIGVAVFVARHDYVVKETFTLAADEFFYQEIIASQKGKLTIKVDSPSQSRLSLFILTDREYDKFMASSDDNPYVPQILKDFGAAPSHSHTHVTMPKGNFMVVVENATDDITLFIKEE
ncbi:MAG: hypothetical protein JW709_07540 [Sedimentisphaerales bacterium]|nr:hypothetical protein [Sedimentisphaerales bacterium]